MNYAFDPTGSSTDNLVSAQRYPVNTSTGGSFYIFPTNSPFFKSGFSATYLGSTGEVRTLVEDVDFSFFLEMKGASATASNPIYAGIRLLNSNLYGNIDITYQALGGKFYTLARQVLDYSRDNDFNSLVAYAALAPYPDMVYAGTTEVIQIDSPQTLTYVAGLNVDVALGMKYLPLPAENQTLIDEGVITGATGELSAIPVRVVSGSTGGGGGIEDGATVFVEGGNSRPVVVSGTVNASVVGVSALAQEATLQRVATAIEGQDLPHNYALENGGNLASLATTTGAQTDSAYAGSGTTTLMGALKGIYAKLAGVLNIRALSSATDTITTVPSGTQAVSVAQLPSTLGQKNAAGSTSMVLASDQPALTVQGPSGTALATNTNVAAVATAVAAIPAVAELLFVNDTAVAPVFYIRRETIKADGSKVVAWFDLDGNAATPNTTLLKVAYSAVGDATLSTQYKATANGSGYNINDVLARVLVVRGDAGATKLLAESWINQTAATKLSSNPPNSDYVLLQQQVTFDTSALATAAKQPALNVDGGALAHITNFPATQTIDGTIVANVGTTGGLALDASLQTLISAVRATVSISTTMWVDLLLSPAAYYIRRESQAGNGTKLVIWEDINGDEVTPNIGNLTPLAGSGNSGGVDVSRADTDSTLVFEATSSGTGYVTGDTLVNIFGLNTDAAPPTVVYNVWVNYGPSVTSPTLLVAVPTAGTYAQATPSVTVGTIALPTNAAQESGGNLAAINTNTSNTVTSIGAGSDAAYAGSGSTTLVGALKGVYAALKSSLNIRALSSATDSVTVQGGNTTAVKVDGSAITQPITGTVIANIGTTGGLALDSSVVALTNALKATVGITGTVWADNTASPVQYYIRREKVNEGTGVITVEWEHPDGSAATPTVANLTPTGDDKDLSVLTDTYTATAGGAGYASGDILIHCYAVDWTFTTPKLAYSIWFNAGPSVTAGTVLSSAPTDGTYAKATQAVTVSALPLPSNAAQESGGNLAAINVATGTAADTAWTGTGSGSLVSLLKGVYTKLAGVLNIRALSSSTDSVAVQGGNATAVKVDGSSVTQPVSLTSVPLAANAALESGGNLAGLNTSQGAITDTAYAGSGNATLVSALKGIYAKLAGVLNTRQLTAATDAVTIQGGNTAAVKTDGSSVTQPISAASLPLPSGAATESGNLATIATAAGAPADATYAGSGSASIISALKGIYAALKGTLNTRALTSASDSITIQGGNSTAVKTDGSATTQPISVSSLPLPTGAATETGNLASISTATGAQTDAAYSGGASGSVIGILKSIYVKLGGTLNTRQLSSATDSITIQGGNSTAVKTDSSATTQPVSAASLPLPAGAATETGNLASISTNTGAKADGAWSGTGDGSVIAILKRISSSIVGVLNIRTISSSTDSITIQGGNSAAVKTDGSATTQPISAVALPLPTNAATETGNLAAIATATGTQADTAYAGSGNAGLVALLKGVYAKLGTTLNIRALTSATDTVKVEGGNAAAVKVDGSATTQPISVSALPLPSGAAIETGNLATIATNTASTASRIGIISDTAYAGTGNSTIIAALKGIYNAITGVLNTRVLSSSTDSILIQGGNSTAVKVDNSGVTQPVTGTITANIGLVNGLALDSSVQALTNAVKATIGITGSVWVDNTVTPNVYYVRREKVNEGTGVITIEWTLVDGTVATPTVANLMPTGDDANISVLSETYTASAGGTGYASGDILIHSYAIDSTLSTPKLAYSIWFNAGPSVTSGTILSTAPTDGTYAKAVQAISATALPLPSNAAKETGGYLQSTAAAAGASGDAEWTGTGTATLISLLKGVFTRLSGTLSIRTLTSATDSVTIQGGNSQAVKVDGSTVTQPVSAAALPLPTGAAKESGGNLDAIHTAIGDNADTSWASGNGSVIAVLKTVADRLLSTLNIRSLSSASDSVTIQGGNSTAVKVDGSAVTQPVSMASAPLPSNAAQETGGNLAAISNATGTTADTTYNGVGTASVIALLKGVYGTLAAGISTRALSSTTDSVAVQGGNTVAVITDSSATTQPISAAALPLPTGAATESGNLATLVTATGSPSDTAYAGSGNSSVIATLRGIYTKLAGALNIRALTASDVVSVQGGNSTAVKTDGSAVTQPVSVSALPLPSGAALEAGNLATLATTQGAVADAVYVSGSGTIVSVLKGIFGKLSGTLTTRALTAATDTVTVQGGNSTAVNVDGSAVTQPVSLASQPLPTGASLETGGNLDAIAAGIGAPTAVAWTGFGSATLVSALKAIYTRLGTALNIRALTASDVVTIQGGNSTAVKTDGSAVTQPVSAAALPLPAGAAIETGNLATIATKVTSSDTVQGAVADAAYAGSGSSTVVAALKGIYAAIKGTLAIRALTAADVVTVQGGNATAVKTDSSATTQPISAAALPLPSGAATETGNLATISTKVTSSDTVQGAVADAAYAGSGSGTVIAILKGVYARLAGTLSVSVSSLPALPAGANAIGSVTVSNLPTTQAVSATALPLPTGAAKETGGNLAAIATSASSTDTKTNQLATAFGTISDVAWDESSANPSFMALQKTIMSYIQAYPGMTWSIDGGNTAAVKVSSTQLPTTLGQKTAANSMSVVLASDQGPQNVTSTGGALALDSSIQSLITAIKATVDISGTVWYDNTVTPVVYYVRRESVNQGTGVITVSWENLNGTAATPTVANLVAVNSSSDIETESHTYTAISSGTGYIAGDLLIHVFGVNTTATPPTIAFSIWFNAGPSVANGTILTTAPTSGTYQDSSASSVSVTSSVLPSNAAQETGGNLATVAANTTATNTLLTTLDTVVGDNADLQYTGTGSSTLVSALKGVYALISTTNTNLGSISNGAWGGSGNASINAILKAIYNKLIGTLEITAVTLPLPTGAATETGNLAAINTQTTALNTVTGVQADAAYSGTGSGSIVSLLKGLFGILNGNLTAKVTTSDAASASTALSALNANVSLPLMAGQNTTIAYIVGVFSGTIQFQGLPQGSATWVNLYYEIQPTGTMASGTVAAAGTYRLSGLAGMQFVRANMATYTSGTATVTLVTSTGVGALEVYQATAANMKVTIGAALPAGAAAIGTVGVTTSVLPTGAATETGNLATIATNTSTAATALNTINTTNTAMSTATGTTADAAWNGSTGTKTIIGLLLGMYNALAASGAARLLSSTTDSVTIQGGNSTAVKTDGSATTQPVSAASLPLPTGAALEAGNLLTVASAAGAPADAAYAGSGNSTIVAGLKGLYSRLTTINGSVGDVSASAWSGTGNGSVSAVVKAIYNKLITTIAITATSLPLPTGAASETGNLATINTSNTAISTATGTISDAVYAGTGDSTLVGLLKGVYAILAGTLNVRALTSADVVTVEGGNATAVKVDGSATTQPISVASLPLPAGAATETGNLATVVTNTTQIANATGTTGSSAYTGTGGTNVVALLKALWAGPANSYLTAATDTVTVQGGNTTAVLVDASATTQPISAASLPLPAGAALEDGGNLDVINTKTTAMASALGTSSTAAWTGTGNVAINGVLKGIYNLLAATLTVNVSSLPALPAGSNAIGSVTVSNLPATQAVSASALPLPSGAATEAGNLATINTSNTAMSTATGAVADAAWSGTGSGSIIAVLKSLYSKLSGTLAISAAALPLPAGAATETGNLATMVTSNAAINTNAGAIADAAWSGSGSGTMNAILKAIYAKVAATLTVNVAQMPTLTKGTQLANGVMTQQFTDAGRNLTTWSMPVAVLNTATETLATLTGFKSGAAVTATSTPPVVTAGKTYRITRVTITYIGTSTIGYAAIKLRVNTAGSVTVTSPLVETWMVGAPSANAGNTTSFVVPIPEGMEFAAGSGIGITVQGFGATGTAAAVGYIQVSIYGYEY